MLWMRLEWNVRHRPLSFSHQEVTSECGKNHRQLRHSYSQREVSRHTRPASVESLASSSIDLKKSHAASVETVGAWSGNNPSVTKSTPHLVQGRAQQRHSASSGGLLQSDVDETGVNMVMRRFKKGSVYDALASKSGLDFSPVVQLKTYNTRRDDSSPLMQAPKPSEKLREKPAKLQHDKSPTKDSDVTNFNDAAKNDSLLSSLNSNLAQNVPDVKRTSLSSKSDDKEGAKCLAAHEKYPSWPVVDAESTSVTYRSHSWTGQTDYPKEKVGFYSRPKKVHQYKISTNQLQPVLERAADYVSSNKTSSDLCSSDRNHGYRPPQYLSCSSSSAECNGKQQFDFEAFHTPCIPQCYEEKDYRIHSPPERDSSSVSSSKAPSEAPTNDSSNGGFLSGREEIRHQAQYSVPLSSMSKPRTPDNKNRSPGAPDTPFLDRLRLENALQMPPPPAPIHPVAVPQLEQQQLQEQRNDYELSSENGTWMGSMESSSHGRGMPKWQGSYSDLSTLSTQLSNRSSLFDSGHSTMPESGRLSPESSCDSTAPSLHLEGPTRAEVVARHGCHREIVAHSARVQQPERHGSESVLYYATGSSIRPNSDAKSPSKSTDGAACSSRMLTEESLYRSHASLTLSPSLSKPDSERENKTNKCPPSRQDSRKSSNSYSSDDSYSRPRCPLSDDTSGSSSDVSNITCISNYKGSAKSASLDKTSPIRDMTSKQLDQAFPKYKTGYEPPKSKSMDETTRKFIFPEVDKRQRVSDPELKAIQKQAVLSFYQRMSLAESNKSDPKPLVHSPGTDTEPPPPYEASTSTRMKMPPPKLSLPPKNVKQLPPRSSHPMSMKPEMPLPTSESGLQNYHSRSVPNLVMLKGQSLDIPASHPIQHSHSIHNQHGRIQKKQGSPLATEEVISWDQLPIVMEKKREANEKKAAPSSESKDPPEDNGGCSSGMHYLKPHKSPRKVQLKEVHHSNETASVRVMTPDGVTLVQTNERKEEKSTSKGPHKRRPAPPPPPKQPPRRPPPPPPPVTPPPTEVVVVVDRAEDEKETQEKLEDLK
ncbi:protein Shroom3 [Nephila pilipes]|uniref:Protein Shroom3 n=1 Tax=Nephila pilipes TaxID=299642 RepID=A0A8X6QMT6_NEPPI|nr:protein Shroom3 [Nephila pilipes]